MNLKCKTDKKLGRVLLGRIKPYLTEAPFKGAKIDMHRNDAAVLTCEFFLTDEMLRALSGSNEDEHTDIKPALDEQDKYLGSRRGYVEVSHFMIMSHPALLERVFRGGAVLDIEKRDAEECSRYYLYHPEFRPISEGDAAPYYSPEVTRPDNAKGYEDIGIKFIELGWG